MRRLLVGSAHYILGPFGPDTDLRRYGLRLCERVGRMRRRERAIVADSLRSGCIYFSTHQRQCSKTASFRATLPPLSSSHSSTPLAQPQPIPS